MDSTSVIREEMEDVMNGVADLSRSSVNSAVRTYESIYEEGTCGCTTFELTENFPCWFKPFNFFFRDRFPFLKWISKEYIPFRLPFVELLYGKYRPRGCGDVCSTLLHDIIAGLAVGLMVVPQALAYARIAGLPLQYGLYSSFMGVFIYAVFGTSKDITLGPTAILSLLTASVIDGSDDMVGMAVLLTLCSGIIQFLLGILNAGFIIDFIPIPVISGFTSAAAITIAMGQVKSLFGLSGVTVRRPFIYCVYDTARYMPHWTYGDFILGTLCILLVLFLRYFKIHIEKLRKSRDLNVVQRIANKFLWLVCTARNAVVVLVASLVGYAMVSYYGRHDPLPISLVDYTSEGQLPNITLPEVTLHNLQSLGTGIIVAPLIGFLESIAIAKAFARENQYIIDPTQELVALGLSNVVSSFFGSYPITGSFSRTAVNSQSGVKTPAAGLVTGSIVLLALGLLSQGFDYIPKASLAAIIIAAVIYMVDFTIIVRIFKIRKIDEISLVVSFFGTLLLGIKYGVPLACLISIILLLYRHSRNRHMVMRLNGALCIVLNGGWAYPGVEFIWKRINYELSNQSSADLEGAPIKAVIIDCTRMHDIDYTVVQGIREGCKELSMRRIAVYIIKVQPHIINTLENAQIQNLFFSSSLDSALQSVRDYPVDHRAQEKSPLLETENSVKTYAKE